MNESIIADATEKVQHNPSPWEVSHIAGFDGPALFATTNGKNVRLCNFLEATEADQHLIAAAPNLLSVCKMVEDLLSGYDATPEENGVLGALRVVIAKAEGRDQ